MSRKNTRLTLNPLEEREVPAVIGVYRDDFQGASAGGAEWTVRTAAGSTVPPKVSTTPVGNRQFLGEFGNATATLSPR
jgi:hypothetical protein